MCYNLGAAAAALALEPEPEPPGPSAPPPRLPGRPRARSARSPPPPRALPALDAVSAAAGLPPLRSGPGAGRAQPGGLREGRAGREGEEICLEPASPEEEEEEEGGEAAALWGPEHARFARRGRAFSPGPAPRPR